MPGARSIKILATVKASAKLLTSPPQTPTPLTKKAPPRGGALPVLHKPGELGATGYLCIILELTVRPRRLYPDPDFTGKCPSSFGDVKGGLLGDIQLQTAFRDHGSAIGLVNVYITQARPPVA